MIDSMEKPPLSSKKFLAYLLAQVSLTGCLILAISKDGGTLVPVQVALVIVQGFLQTGFILGQAYIDRYVRVARIAAGHVAEPGDG